MAVPYLFDAVFDDDEVTAKHSPAPELLLEARSTPRTRGESVSGVALIQRAPPPPSHRKLLPLHSLRNLRDLYAAHMGPAARPLLLSAIASLKATPEAFPLALQPQLLNLICSHFDDPKVGRKFYEEAVRLLDQE